MDKRSARAIEKERIENALNLLRIIYTNVQKSKRSDRFIVNTGEKVGVVDGEGNVIIPVEYTRIVTSNDRIFRVYGEICGYGVFGLFQYGSIREQAIFDYEGNKLVEFAPFSKTVNVGKRGILLGYNEYEQGKHDYVYHVDYNGNVIEFDESVNTIMVSDLLPELLILNHTEYVRLPLHLSDEEIRNRALELLGRIKGIRLDEGTETKPLEACYDKIEKFNREDMTAGGKSYKDNGYIKYAISQCKEDENLHIGTINGNEIMLDEWLIPVMPYNKAYKHKKIYH